MKNIRSLVFLSLLILPFTFFAQNYRWQQKIAYEMDIDFNVENHQFTGTQTIEYQNNSPDTLKKVYYHLFFNAFQPGSMMDVRSRSIEDPDRRIGDRIQDLSPEDIGYQKVKSLKQKGKNATYKMEGTILEVTLAKPLLPHSSTELEMEFEGQVPSQIRRSGRDNAEGISYSMAQWYPKLCEYDFHGWHANPYIAREFHGVWGDFDVKINIDESYTVAATGLLQNPDKIGHGYVSDGEAKPAAKGGKLKWHFKANNVHDFVWAADPDYTHTVTLIDDGPAIHLFYQQDSSTTAWEELADYMDKAFQFLNEHFGKYPYEKYSFIQGGDGGMEYPMATLITGNRSLRSLVGVSVHELVHSWYQMVLASNESRHAWMDEGFTTYVSGLVTNHLFGENEDAVNPHNYAYQAYFNVVNKGIEEAQSTHADHFNTNKAYSVAAYYKGVVFMHQLSYIIGEDAIAKSLKIYFEKWKFKHPEPEDFKRIAEQVSDIELDWYFDYWINSTHNIDYGIKTLIGVKNTTHVTIERVGRMMMPLEVVVTMNDGKKKTFYIPMRIMFGEKPADDSDGEWITQEDWPWTSPEYILKLPMKASDIAEIEIDPSQAMADINRENNLIKISDYTK